MGKQAKKDSKTHQNNQSGKTHGFSVDIFPHFPENELRTLRPSCSKPKLSAISCGHGPVVRWCRNNIGMTGNTLW